MELLYRSSYIYYTSECVPVVALTAHMCSNCVLMPPQKEKEERVEEMKTNPPHFVSESLKEEITKRGQQ